MPRFHEFRELLEVDEARLRDLVAGGGDPPERLWAVWALALRRDPDVGGIARSVAGGDPSPGVRAHMALLLVSLGERDAAMTLARHDPESIVRASAYRHLSRTAKPDDAVLHDLIASAMRTDPADEVHAAIADAVRSDAPERVWLAVIERLGDTTDAVRANVVDALLRRWGRGTPFPSQLRARVSEEPNASIRGTVLRAWIGAEGISSVLLHVDVAGAVHAIDYLIAEGGSLTNDDVDSLVARGAAAVDARVANLHGSRRIQLPLRWMCELVIRFFELQDPTWSNPESSLRYSTMQAALETLGPALGAAVTVTTEERVVVTRLRDVLEAQALRASSELGTDVETLVRFTRGEDIDAATQERVQWLDDFEEAFIPGLGLLADLRRLGG